MSNDSTNTNNTTNNGTSESEQGKWDKSEAILHKHGVTIYIDGKEQCGFYKRGPILRFEGGGGVFHFTQKVAELTLPYFAHYARTGRLENPPAGALNRETLGRLCYAEYMRNAPHPSAFEEIPDHLREANCRAAEAVAAYVLAQTPEPVELDREAFGRLVAESRWRFMRYDHTWEDITEDSRESYRRAAEAVLARYAAQAPIAPQPAGVVEASRDCQACGKRGAKHGPLCDQCQAQAALSALPSAGSEEDRDNMLEERAKLISERDKCRAVLMDAKTDIFHWVKFAEKQWAEMSDPEHNPFAPTKAGISESRQLMDRISDALRACGDTIPDPKLYEHWQQFKSAGPGHQVAEKLAGITYDRNKLLAERDHAVDLLRIECKHSNSLASERDRCREMNDTLTAERDALRAQVVTLEAERDQLRAEVEERGKHIESLLAAAGERKAEEERLRDKVLRLRDEIDHLNGVQAIGDDNLSNENRKLRAEVERLQEDARELCISAGNRIRALDAERDELVAEREKLRAKVDRLTELLEQHRRYHGKVGCPGQEDCYVCSAEQFDIQYGDMPKPTTPTPPDPRRVVEGMRVRANGADETWIGWGEGVIAKDSSGVDDWDVLKDGKPIDSFSGTVLPHYLDPLPAEPVEATPPTPEPADIVLPEAVKQPNGDWLYRFPDGSRIIGKDDMWLATRTDGSYILMPPATGETLDLFRQFPDEQEAARALRDIGQGPGAVAPKTEIDRLRAENNRLREVTAEALRKLGRGPVLDTSDLLGENNTCPKCGQDCGHGPMCAMCSMEEMANTTAQPTCPGCGGPLPVKCHECNDADLESMARDVYPAEPAIDVERLADAVARAITAHWDSPNQKEGEEAARAAILAALGGKE